MAQTIDPVSGAAEIAPGVFVFTSGAFALNATAVFARAGRGCLLVDPAYFPSDLDRIAGFLEGRGRIADRIVLTHSDWDHVVGPARFPGASVLASALYPERVRAEGARIVRAAAEFDAKLYVPREPPLVLPVPAGLVGSPSDVVWEGPRAHLLPAGGHTPDGLMLLLAEQRILVAGDHLSDREIPFVGDGIAPYLATLAMVRALVRRGEVGLLVPGHGAVCGEAELLERIAEDEDYLVRLDAWVRETSGTVPSVAGLLERCEEVVFRKGAGVPDVAAEHRANVALHARTLGLS